MARGRKIALDALRRVSTETTELFDRLATLSDRAKDRSSEVLVGVTGAASFLLLTYGVSIALPVVSFAVGGPIAACVGLPLGILAWRGRRRFRIERETTENRLRIEAEIEENRLKAEEILRRLKGLPKDAPQQLKDALYLEYLSLAAALRLQPHDPSNGSGSIFPLALPAPTQQPLALAPPAVSLVSPKEAEPVSPGKKAKSRSRVSDST